jgi:hypothetical protein
VVSNSCVGCPAGTTNIEGDSAASANTNCDPTPCTKGANGQACANGTPTGDLVNDNCGCQCHENFRGANCQTAIPCTAGNNGQACQNNGTPMGTLAADNCQCSCTMGYQGGNCESSTQCMTGADGNVCQNNGSPAGTTGDCTCQCQTGYTGDNCETVVQCTKAANGKVCQNGGTITGTVAANNCQCQCTQQLEGPNCEKCPSGMYLLNQNCVACGEGNDYSCPSGEFKSGTVCSGKFVASFGCCFFYLHVCFHCLLCLPYLTQVMVPPIHRRAWFVVTVGPLGCVPLVFRKVGLRAMVPRRKINKVVLWQLRLLPPMNRSIQLQHRPLWFQHRPLRFQHRPLRFQHQPLRFQTQTTWCTTTF